MSIAVGSIGSGEGEADTTGEPQARMKSMARNNIIIRREDEFAFIIVLHSVPYIPAESAPGLAGRPFPQYPFGSPDRASDRPAQHIDQTLRLIFGKRPAPG